MKVCILSDNRTGLNWGARATSIALSQLIGRKHEIVGTIYNDLKVKNICLYHKLFSLFKTEYFTSKSLSKEEMLVEKILVKLRLIKRINFCSLEIEKNVENYQNYSATNRDLKFIEKQISSAEMIVVNGEGDMIFTSERYTLIFLLTIMQIAINRGIKVAFLNSMISYPNNISSDINLSKNDILLKKECIKILRQCEKIQLRERRSALLLNDISADIAFKVVPDALFTWHKELIGIELSNANVVLCREMEKFFGMFCFDKPYICISGSSIIRKRDKREIIKSYVKLVESLKSKDYNTYLIVPCTGDNFLHEVGAITNVPVISVYTSVLWGAKILSNARLYISGRYHPSIMASLGGTPLLCFESNSHKMVGLQELINVQNSTHFDLPLSDSDIREIVLISRDSIFNSELRIRIEASVAEISREVETSIQEI